MAANKNVLQQVNNVSVNKLKLLEIANMDSLTEIDLRVFLCLLTELNGYSESTRSTDPMNFKKIDKSQLSDYLLVKKKIITKSIDKIIALGLIEKGSSDTIENGYRFTF